MSTRPGIGSLQVTQPSTRLYNVPNPIGYGTFTLLVRRAQRNVRVAVVSGGGHSAGGRLAELTAAVAAAGHEVRVYVRADGRHQSAPAQLAAGVPVEHVSAGPARSMSETALLPHTRLFGERLAAGWRRDWLPDLVHAYSWLGGLAAVVAGGGARVPVAVTYHETGAARRRQLGDGDASPPCRVGLERELGRAVGRVIIQSRADLGELTRLGVPRRQLALIPSGVDPDSFAPTRPVAPRRPGPRRIVAVGSVGGLAERKGFADLIRALRHVPDAEMVVIGGPPEVQLGRDREVRRLRALARGCGVGDRIRFAGRVPREQMPQWYRSADLVVCASWYAPSGAAAVEAMATGVPVVATAVGGLRDAVVDGVTGELVPPHQPAILGRAVRGLLADPIRRLEYAAAGLDRARQCYAWDRVASRLDTLYRQLRPA